MPLVMPALLSQLDQLISLPSVSSANSELDMSNKGVIYFLAEAFESMGFSCEIITCNNNKFNLIATLGSGPGGLVLAGHTDTVPFDQELWSRRPFPAYRKRWKNIWIGYY